MISKAKRSCRSPRAEDVNVHTLGVVEDGECVRENGGTVGGA